MNTEPLPERWHDDAWAASRETRVAQPSLASLARRALAMVVMLTLITGVAYPLAITAVAQVLFHDEANGSLVRDAHGVHGSRLIGQPFEDPKYFWGRPSHAGAFAYDARASAASNFGPTNTALTKRAKERIAALRAADPENVAPVPVDLVTASASGLDPHISVAAARYQLPRVARARRMSEDRVHALVEASTEPRTLGILGEPRVNVLKLNLALDSASE